MNELSDDDPHLDFQLKRILFNRLRAAKQPHDVFSFVFMTPLQKGYLTAEIAEIAEIFKNQFKISELCSDYDVNS